MTGLNENWATLWEAFADAQPDQMAVAVGDHETTWRELDQGAARVATALTERGVGPDTRIAQLMFNCPEYIESAYAAFKVRASPVNVNYRYKSPEIAYICDNAGAEVLIFHGSLADRVDGARASMPTVRVLLQVDDGSPLLDGAEWYHEVRDAAAPAERIERSGDDMLLLYTGGTTGNPKGVMWRHVDLWGALGNTNYRTAGIELPTTPAEVGAVAARLQADGVSPVLMCAPPLMHGTALFLAIGAFVMGGSVVLLGGRSFDPDELWKLVERHKVTQISLVGDAFARPLTAAVTGDGSSAGRDISSLQRIVSTGATLSADQKRLFQAVAPQVTIMDMIGASEGGPYALAVTPPGTEPLETAVFTALPNVVTLSDETGEPLPIGSDIPGRLAASGPQPRGYWKDPEKTAATFPNVNGVQYTAPGDYALIAEDGRVTLLGRGSVCINSGGEKIYPEEVEVAARLHPNVLDANVVGTPHERFGETVTLVCSVREPTDPDELIGSIKEQIADYKAPRQVVFVDEIYRAPNGKADYRWARDTAVAALAD
ncbi:AMP-binding protein [Ilumatobacter coccineus]|uniref:Fatty-acid--CoA ligase n=1 Tax=Ilumatobacter coccineus (strain NBRC 103263 / KCTC 29153 / YM16-304) TaxID=1313172 RepID=A0A6C7E6V5_ILUCY|nr:AMP-binding protein [Ilumatobacter coccineus]BAN03434.1 fatty-acid--CoA ligase [Ilumatobacter coccineus YM16-304]